MSESKHTKGPWVEKPEAFGRGIFILPKEETEAEPAVALVIGRTDRDANARLISAAPDMLEALKAIMAEPHGCPFCDSGTLRKPDDPNKGHDADCGYFLAEVAIAKATGE